MREKVGKLSLIGVSRSLKSPCVLELPKIDYHPFGMVMPERRYNGPNYRFGFNGKENDNEVKGNGNQQDYGMRIHDPRYGRFLSLDPLMKKYPQLTPYQFAANRPIDGVDLDGLEHCFYMLIFDKRDGKTVVNVMLGGTRWNPSNTTYSVYAFGEGFNLEFKTYDEMKKFVVGKTVDQIRKASDERLESVMVQSAITQASVESHDDAVFQSAKADASFSEAANYSADESGVTFNPSAFRSGLTPNNSNKLKASSAHDGLDEVGVTRSNIGIRSANFKIPSRLEGREVIVDENISPTVASILRVQGFNVKRFDNGTSDLEITKHAQANNSIVLTANTKDFVNKGITVLKVTPSLQRDNAKLLEQMGRLDANVQKDKNVIEVGKVVSLPNQ